MPFFHLYRHLKIIFRAEQQRKRGGFEINADRHFEPRHSNLHYHGDLRGEKSPGNSLEKL